MLYIVVCKYEGCEEGDNGGYHVLIVTGDRDQAYAVRSQHSWHNPEHGSMHVSYFSADVHEMETGKLYDNIYW